MPLIKGPTSNMPIAPMSFRHTLAFQTTLKGTKRKEAGRVDAEIMHDPVVEDDKKAQM